MGLATSEGYSDLSDVYRSLCGEVPHGGRVSFAAAMAAVIHRLPEYQGIDPVIALSDVRERLAVRLIARGIAAPHLHDFLALCALDQISRQPGMPEIRLQDILDEFCSEFALNEDRQTSMVLAHALSLVIISEGFGPANGPEQYIRGGVASGLSEGEARESLANLVRGYNELVAGQEPLYTVSE